MNLNDIYKYFLSQGMSASEAAQATLWQAITNPTGNITQLKAPERWYSDQEIYDYYAPNYSSALNFPVQRDPQTKMLAPDVDPLAAYTSESIKNVLKNKGKITFGDISNIASNAAKVLKKPEYGSKLFSDYNITTQDYYNQLKDIVNEYTTAQKQIETQSKTHPFAQRGLPNPNLRYGVRNDATKNTIAYPGIDEYFKNKVRAQEQALRKQGATGNDLKVAMDRFADTLSTNIEKKIDASGVTPFLLEAKNLISVKKKGK